MAETFIPVDFEPPVDVRVGKYVLRPLAEVCVDLDLAAVNANVDLIKATRGGTWPRAAITREENLTDLVEHHRQFRDREAFAYSILTPDQSEYVGCIYISPPNHPFDDSDKSGIPPDADALVNFWVTQDAYDAGFYVTLSNFVATWIRNDWPFRRPYISNTVK